MNVVIEVEPQIWAEACSHLLDRDPAREQAAFFFASEAVREQTRLLTIFGARHIMAEELAFHSSYHLELKEKTWSSVIKEAHQLSASLIELHSHLGGYPAEFSPSDIGGLKNTAPHVAWRIKGRIFAALVLTRSDFDALTWLPGQKDPTTPSALLVGDQTLLPTQRSQESWNDFRSHPVRSEHCPVRS